MSDTMRMKDVLKRTGLTDRAVRLYIDAGLLSPRQESLPSKSIILGFRRSCKRNFIGSCEYA